MKIIYTIIFSLLMNNALAQGKFFGGNGDGFAANQTAMILPVNLISFEANLKNNIAQITWAATAQQIASFVVEFSNDGNRFENLTEKTVAENTMAPVQYGYADGPRTGLWYYRLKWQEADGSLAYSKVVAVSFPAMVKLQVYFDASAGSITITKPAKESILEIYSADGKLQKIVRNYQPVCKVSVEELPAGVYIVRVSGGRAFARFIKMI